MDANIQKYQAFVEVADAGSFTKAAETLAYSQSGIMSSNPSRYHRSPGLVPAISKGRYRE